MAAVDVQRPTEVTVDVQAELIRSQSQALKQVKVEQVKQRLLKQQEPVRKLLDFARQNDVSLAALQEVEEQQKAARNIGEDLMEDMLQLDSLANLYQEDRKIRKKALAEIENLVEQVDSAKSLLLQRRKEIEKALAEAEESPARIEDEKASSLVSLERLAEMRLPVTLQSKSLPDAYVVSGFVRGLKREDLELELRGPVLKIKATRRPTPQELDFLQRTLRGSQEDVLKVGKGVFGRIHEELQLPADVATNEIQATCREGQLRIVLPRKRLQRPAFPW